MVRSASQLHAQKVDWEILTNPSAPRSVNELRKSCQTGVWGRPEAHVAEPSILGQFSPWTVCQF